MSENQQRSFIAKIKYDNLTMTFFEKIFSERYLNRHPNLPENSIATSIGNNFTPYDEGYFPSSNSWLPLHYGKGANKPVVSVDDMLLHFRCYDDYYNLQILSTPYSDQYINKNSAGDLAALPAAGGDTTSFNLLDADHNIITLDDISTDNPTVFLKARNAQIIKTVPLLQLTRNYYFNDKSGEDAKFNLQIIERNAPPRD